VLAALEMIVAVPISIIVFFEQITNNENGTVCSESFSSAALPNKV
jgi:hypothetical protein